MEKLIGQIAALCYRINTTTEADVFFEYAPHCNCYDVRYYKDGWKIGEDFVYMDIATDITESNLQATINKLKELKATLKPLTDGNP